MQEASKNKMLVEEVDGKAFGPVINFIYTGELELGDLADNIWGNEEIFNDPDLRKGFRKDPNSNLFHTSSSDLE